MTNPVTSLVMDLVANLVSDVVRNLVTNKGTLSCLVVRFWLDNEAVHNDHLID